MAGEKKSHLLKSKGENGDDNGLILYYFHHSFHSQKVIMALHEKNIPFTLKLVDVTKEEQYEPWFLKINPMGSVPVLKDGIKYIPDSKRIIGYLEDNFSNGEYSRLIPLDQGLHIKQKIISFHDKICKISPHTLTMGTIINNKWCTNPKYPYKQYFFRRSLKASLFSNCQTLRKHAANNLKFRNVLLQKADFHEKNNKVITDPEKYVKLIEEIEDLLTEVELELAEHNQNQCDWWLCCDRFTVADISLAVLLSRLSSLGMERNFWTGGMRPQIEIYYKRVQERDSFKKAMPTPMTDFSFFLKSKASLIIGVSLFTAITITIGGYLYLRK